jgi:hypothetical protein
MSGQFIPGDIAQFILEKIDSGTQPAATLLIGRSAGDHWRCKH